jgi:hypothetical protein
MHMDPGLRRDDDHASACAQFDYALFRGGDDKWWVIGLIFCLTLNF